jgi:2,3-bisphosphoglycerate-dependent phosphoglycerate mutase
VSTQTKQTDLYLVRHGETATNRAQLIQGWDSEPLNARGRWQAERAGQRLAQVGLQALYASPLDRARETATIIGRLVGLEVILVKELREMDTGLISGMHRAQFMLRHPRLMWAWLRDDSTLAFPNGEVMADFYQRARRAIDGLIARHAGQAITVVAHGGTISGYLSLLLQGRGSNRIAWKLRNGAICHVRWQGDRPPQLLALNDTAHLFGTSQDQ